MIKTLTLLILIAIVIASVACGPSKKALCEDAQERFEIAKDRLSQGSDAVENAKEAKADIDEYCKD